MSAKEVQHDYHLVDPSPWPAVGAVSAFVLAVGAILWMRHMFAVAPLIFGIGALGVGTMIGWWRDVTRRRKRRASIPAWCRFPTATG
jgi:cytochrome c oxidase subunit 3